ncbi:hypothetical protein [Klebsiella variicola]|uniref:hypothetical protein n=1 Tax=Klebsiella variicola TaxID=244366 RepID=UPI0015EAA810|nr:hypothetical protein [Klebsiella variicola]QLS59449.1 hypothetical protein HV312_08975 [Klebsiella variicola]
MAWLHVVSYFFGGVFLANALPHLVSGMMGESFQSPFANPPGKGLSSSTVNVLWGFVNLCIGYLLICHIGEFDLKITIDAVALGAGVLVIGLVLARQFGRLHGGNNPGQA